VRSYYQTFIIDLIALLYFGKAIPYSYFSGHFIIILYPKIPQVQKQRYENLLSNFLTSANVLILKQFFTIIHFSPKLYKNQGFL